MPQTRRAIAARIARPRSQPPVPPTVIASIYGMNFDHMPELHWLLGYPLALLGMVVAVAVLYRAFKRSGWL